jgi:poly-gamma-glutamate synthesis protein (capsule biosynthesis protein)
LKKTIILIFILLEITLAEKITLSFVGDILLAGSSGRRALEFGMDYPLKKVAPILKNDDLTLANLECALTGKIITRNVRVGKERRFIFKTPPKLGQVLKEGGVDIVTLANNHSLNGGIKGLRETMETLGKLDIAYCGAGENFEEAHKARIINLKGRKIAFLGYNDLEGAAAQSSLPQRAFSKNSDQVIKDVQKTRKNADLVIVTFHWGIELQQKPTSRQINLAHKSIDAGADIVIGHHPHCLQPIEIYQNKIICYSLGNFVFDNSRPLCAKTMILQIIYDSETKKQEIKKIPCYIIHSQPTPCK